MTASRHCGCGAQLEERGDLLLCPSCGAEARAWLVALDGDVVGAGDRVEAFVAPMLLHERLGVSQAAVERAARPDFVEPVRRSGREAEAETVILPHSLSLPRGRR